MDLTLLSTLQCVAGGAFQTWSTATGELLAPAPKFPSNGVDRSEFDARQTQHEGSDVAKRSRTMWNDFETAAETQSSLIGGDQIHLNNLRRDGQCEVQPNPQAWESDFAMLNPRSESERKHGHFVAEAVMAAWSQSPFSLGHIR